MKTITIVGKRWFQKTYGNTYFSAVGIVDGDVVAEIEFEYGYGDMYVQRIVEELAKKGYFPGIEEHQPAYRYCLDNKIKLTTLVSDVSRRKDL
jgi:hypothetical protein